MTTESELRRENLQLRAERDILRLRQENRDLKRQIERLQNGKPAERSIRPPKEPTDGIPILLKVAGYLALAMSACVSALYLYSAFTKLTGL